MGQENGKVIPPRRFALANIDEYNRGRHITCPQESAIMPFREILIQVLTSLLVSMLLATVGSPSFAAKPIPGWAAWIDATRENLDLAEGRKQMIDAARKVAGSPIAKRVYRYEDVGKHRTWLDGRAKAMDGCPRQQWFALAMSDFGTSNILRDELPLLALAYRVTGEEAFKKRIIAQLEETVTWSPIQRPGYTLYMPVPDPVPENFNDGNWLATGTGIRGLGDMLDILPEGSLPEPLELKVRELLRKEIASIADDWHTKRSWFIRGNCPRTNQWVLPTEGLIRACLLLGKENHPDEYELGVKNMLEALDAQGPHGEFYEGIGYANFTVKSMLSAAHAMAVAGDRRAIDHSFLRRFPTWMAHHLQPGRFRINCFDAGAARVPRTDKGSRGLMSLFLLLTNDPVARWTLNHQFSGPSDDHIGFLAKVTTGPEKDPSLFAAYGSARRVNWRSSWKDDATGVWIRGGHPLDGHDHQDRGHVNFILRGKPILIESGTPSYDNPRLGSHYSSILGHNVLEILGQKAKKAPAKIEIHRLDGDGGEVVIDPTPGYPGVKRWTRKVSWDADRLDVEDEVVFPAEAPRAACFRWHLGTREEVNISGSGNEFRVTWKDAQITLRSSVPITVSTELFPDNTVNLGEKTGPDYLHLCVVVRTSQPCENWTLKTNVVGK